MSTPEHDSAVRESCRRVQSDMRELAEFARQAGYPGYADKCRNASERVKSLTESYLAACDEVDRLSEDGHLRGGAV